MPGSNYTGDETATQAPSPTPDTDESPIFVLPNDGDPLNAASVAQAFKTPADAIDFLWRMPTFGPWGRSVTDATIAADTLLTGPGHTQYRNLTINAGKTVTKQDPGIILVSGILTIANTGKIVFGLKTGGLNGNNAVLSTQGAAGVGWNHGAAPFHNGGPILGGGDGGAGGDASHMTAAAGDNTGYSLGGFGGAGGTANTTAGPRAPCSPTAFARSTGVNRGSHRSAPPARSAPNQPSTRPCT